MISPRAIHYISKFQHISLYVNAIPGTTNNLPWPHQHLRLFSPEENADKNFSCKAKNLIDSLQKPGLGADPCPVILIFWSLLRSAYLGHGKEQSNTI